MKGRNGIDESQTIFHGYWDVDTNVISYITSGSEMFLMKSVFKLFGPRMINHNSLLTDLPICFMQLQ